MKFELESPYIPKGDQPEAIKQLTDNIAKKVTSQVLLGATGTGKTFTIANIIQKTQKKTVIIAHNKTLVGQLYTELKQLFPKNHVEYFVSYFDFYQPEAYKPSTDTFIDKSATSNQEIEMMRLSALNSLSTQDDVIIVASVASIYSTVNPTDFSSFMIIIKENEKINRKQFIYDLVRLQYKRDETSNLPGTFKVNGDIIHIFPGHTDEISYRIMLDDEKIETIQIMKNKEEDVKDGDFVVFKTVKFVKIIPANEYIANKDNFDIAIKNIKEELKERIEFFTKNNKLLEAQRIEQRTNQNIEMLLELGYCNGIENYSRQLELREPNSTPYTIFDYLKNDDWLLVIDESHITVPQIEGMFNTDKSRKETLVEYGFRLPSCLDNRPLNFNEFNKIIKNAIFVSATPRGWEIKKSNNTVIQQIIRPTGLLDPIIEIVKTEGQIENLMQQLDSQIKKNEKTFITVITIALAEQLATFLHNKGYKVAYLHNELKTIDRSKIINDLRKGIYDAIVGINLLKEGLDVPEVSLVCIFDADKPGLFRNKISLIQIIGRAARNVNGRIIMYADTTSSDMQQAIDETNRRRKIQIEFNKKHNITPTSIVKPINNLIDSAEQKTIDAMFHKKNIDLKNKTKAIAKLKKEMKKAAEKQEYELAASLRDLIIELEGNLSK
ncbi:MAG: excinuclease ABC subunit UvrB [Mycoplasmataceae bacterium]|nr:excinuclease ABC subunit UvrB [Mycoplasmataceae bacterium]